MRSLNEHVNLDKERRYMRYNEQKVSKFITILF
jgi:hypothetical protein